MRILLEEHAERPNDPFTLFNLGFDRRWKRGPWARRLGYLKSSPGSIGRRTSITRKLFALIARCHQMLR